jgi:hypothetical protein
MLVGPGAHRSDAARSASAPKLFVAQSASGSGDGSSCSNARPVSFFNTAANWGGGKAISPGTTVGLCGTISSTVVVQGSGVSGSPVTVLFTPGSKISQPACGPCLSMDNRSFVTVNGGKNGVIEGTNNGTHLGMHVNSDGIHAASCNNCVIENLTIQNIYVHDGSGNNVEIDQTQVRSIWANGSNFSIHDNKIHDAGWSVFFDGSSSQHDFRVYNNDIYNVDHGFIVSGESPGPIWFNNNHVHDFANWDTSSNSYHHDGIHCYTVDNGQPHHIDDFYIYNNRFDGDIGGNATAWIFMEDGSGPQATPCADPTSNIWVFNNVATLSNHIYNGAFGLFTGRNRVFNNTLIGHGQEAGTVCQFVARPGMAMQNNVCASANQLIGMNPTEFSAGSPDYNVYADGGNNAFVCGNSFISFNQFSRWQTCIGGDSHSIHVADARLNPNESPQAGSPLVGAGTSLASICTGNLRPLCFDINGALRPIRMRPDAGAYQAETAAIAGGAIGRARIGAPRATVERFYGSRQRTPTRRPLFGLFDVRGTVTATYRLHGGQLKVSYVGDRVVAVSTTSQYYTTTDGIGVGAETTESRLTGSGWQPCGRNYAKRRGGNTTAIRLGGGHVVAVAVSRPARLHCG